MTLDDARRVLAGMGIEPAVVRTCAPRVTREGGTLRVIRVRGNELTVSAFLDGMPSQKTDDGAL